MLHNQRDACGKRQVCVICKHSHIHVGQGCMNLSDTKLTLIKIWIMKAWLKYLYVKQYSVTWVWLFVGVYMPCITSFIGQFVQQTERSSFSGSVVAGTYGGWVHVGSVPMATRQWLPVGIHIWSRNQTYNSKGF